MADLIDDQVLAELRNNPPRYFVSDNLSWLNNAVSKVRGISLPDCGAVLTDRLATHFEFIRAFHGCRAVTTTSYQTKGIIACDPAALDQLAHELFGNRELIQQAIQELAKSDRNFSYREHNQGKVWFCLEAEELTEFCGHYLLSGSEYLQSIASRIGDRDTLRQRGRATIIECDVPVADVPKDTLSELAGVILEMIAEKYCVRPYQPEILGFGFCINTHLAPENIVKFHFPSQIPNPHNYLIRED